jgi:hypothetical protein
MARYEATGGEPVTAASLCVTDRTDSDDAKPREW